MLLTHGDVHSTGDNSIINTIQLIVRATGRSWYTDLVVRTNLANLYFEEHSYIVRRYYNVCLFTLFSTVPGFGTM